MGFAPSWEVPYSAKRLLRLCKDWTFESEMDRLPAYDDNDEPRHCRAFRRIQDALRAWRDHHDVIDDAWFDQSKQSFHVCDVAIVFDEYRRLLQLEQKVIDALGPPTVKQRWNRKAGKFEPDV